MRAQQWWTGLVAVGILALGQTVHAQTTGGMGAGGGIGSGAGIGAGPGIGTGGGIGTGARTGGAGGAGFAGGTSGAQFTGGAGGSGFVGGAGAIGGGRTTGVGGTAVVIPTTSNPFVSTYANPYAAGLSGASTVFSYKPTPPAYKPFGQPIWSTTTTTASASTGTNGQATGFSTIGMIKAPSYVTVLSDDIPFVQHHAGQLQTQIQAALERSSFLKEKNVTVQVDGDTVILLGTAASERERRLIEGMVRLTPGVRNVDNQLDVIQTGPLPKKN